MMMVGRKTLVALSLAIAACSGEKRDAQTQSSDTTRAPATARASADTTNDAARRGPRVVILGTSLTSGFGLDDPTEAWPAIMQRKADAEGVPVRVVNAGLSGETSAGALRRVEWVIGDSADVVVIETGANDGLRGIDPAVTASNIRSIIDLIRAKVPRAKIAVVQMEAPPNLGADYTTRFHDLFGSVARKSGVTLIPFLLEGVAGKNDLNQPDGIHPNAQGAAIVAQNMWNALRPLIRGPK